MITSRDRVVECLAELKGLPLHGSHRTLNMESFLFGDYGDLPNTHQRHLAPLILQTECDWILRYPRTLLTIRSDESSRTQRLSQFLQWFNGQHPAQFHVQKILLPPRGGLRLKLSGGCDLRVELRHPEDCWRFLRFDGRIVSADQDGYRETPPTG